MSRVFYVLTVHEPILRNALNLLRIACAPNQKHEAHITVRGPYSRKLSDKYLAQINAQIAGKRIWMQGAGDFFSHGQSTVFLKVRREKLLRDVWYKPHYPFNPHLSIYDGPNLLFAQRVSDILKNHYIRLSFKAEKLIPLESTSGQSMFSFENLDSFGFDSRILEREVGEPLPELIRHLRDNVFRLKMIEKAAYFLQHYSYAQKCDRPLIKGGTLSENFA